MKVEDSNNVLKSHIESVVSDVLDRSFSSIQINLVPGGSRDGTFQIVVDRIPMLFCKVNVGDKCPGILQKESIGLNYLARQGKIRTPQVISYKIIGPFEFLLTEWINCGVSSKAFWEYFGTQLAAIHQLAWVDDLGRNCFGFEEDNYLGRMFQSNRPCFDWHEFFISRRIEPQLKIARNNGFLGQWAANRFDKLFNRLSEIFDESRSSLLHGDLWNGNYMCSAEKTPVLIDPAVYFGHRSMDIAMTTLYGGFDSVFYDAYSNSWPFPENYREQWDICNLYPLLVHLNLIGKSYLESILRTIRRF